MNKRKTWFYCSLIVTAFSIALLVTGSSLLTMGLGKNSTVPLGTFITWAGLVSLPLTIYWSNQELRNPTIKQNAILAKILKLIIILAILWVPISYFLAGNLSFSFTESKSFQSGQMAMKLFWYLSYGIGIGSISIVLIYWISLVLRKIITAIKNE